MKLFGILIAIGLGLAGGLWALFGDKAENGRTMSKGEEAALFARAERDEGARNVLLTSYYRGGRFDEAVDILHDWGTNAETYVFASQFLPSSTRCLPAGTESLLNQLENSGSIDKALIQSRRQHREDVAGSTCSAQLEENALRWSRKLEKKTSRQQH